MATTKFFFLIILSIAFFTNSSIILNNKCKKVLLTGTLAFGLSINQVIANDALDGALKAMTTTKEKTLEERDFDSLPSAAKKRKAIEYCKDSSRRSNSDYKSASDCTSAVINGDFSIVSGQTSKKSTPSSQISSSPISSSPILSSPISSSSPILSSKSSTAIKLTPTVTQSVPKTSEKKLEKVQDLSDLSTASKKRRSLAACKKASTRKFAGMGSESKCTESVLSGNYDSLIEALELGK